MSQNIRWGLAGVLVLLLGGCAGSPPDTIGVNNGRLADCPWAPRCVSSQSSDPDDRVAPIRYTTSLAVARQTMISVIRAREDARIVKVEENYIHARFRSNWLGFVDDLELLFVPAESLIHVRSSARRGYYDFDVNRKRINTLRSHFLTTL